MLGMFIFKYVNDSVAHYLFAWYISLWILW